MAKLRVNPEVSAGHIFSGVSLLIAATAMYFGVQTDIATEAAARELADVRTAVILERVTKQLDSMDRWQRQHEVEWAAHRAGGTTP